MLVLSRKIGETIVIGNEIEVKVLSVRGKRTRIGVKAPSNARILRGELDEWSELSFGESKTTDDSGHTHDVHSDFDPGQ